MKIKLLQYLLIYGVLGLLCTFDVQASVTIEITGGQASGLPIAIVPFNKEGAEGEGLEDIAQVIKSDLENSGQFKGTPFQEIRQFPNHPAAVQYPYWQSLGVEDLVIGRIQKTGSSKYSVSFQLLDVIRHKSNGGTQMPLLTMQFDNIPANQLRALAHHISDMIFEKLIGIRGIFSTRIAYISVSQGAKGTIHTLEVADSDGHNPKPLYRSNFPLMSPSWSPEGRRIAFVSFEKDRSSVNIVDVLTGRVERVTQFPGINGAPAWSPNGRTLALVLSKDGSPKVYMINLDSKQLTRLTDGMGIDTEPCFTPNGQALVFTSSRGGKPQIYQVTLASGKIERLTFSGDYNAKPSITPDGKRLVMLHRGDNGLFGIAVQTLGSSDLKVLTQTSLNDSPTLAPNGMMVLYGSQEGGRGILGAVSLDGRVKIRLPSREGDVQEPAWSPFVR
jgi:TolB protein